MIFKYVIKHSMAHLMIEGKLILKKQSDISRLSKKNVATNEYYSTNWHIISNRSLFESTKKSETLLKNTLQTLQIHVGKIKICGENGKLYLQHINCKK